MPEVNLNNNYDANTLPTIASSGSSISSVKILDTSRDIVGSSNIVKDDDDHDDKNDGIGVVNIVVIGCGWWSQGWHIPQLFTNPNVHLLAFIDTANVPQSSLNPNLESLIQLSTRYGSTSTSISSSTLTTTNTSTVCKPVPIYSSVSDFLQDTKVSSLMDGAIIATPHSSHYSICEILLNEGIRRISNCSRSRSNSNSNNDNNSNNDSSSNILCRPISILMEKPMTTDVVQAYKIHELVQRYHALLQRENDDDDNNNNKNNKFPICHFYVNHSANFRIQASIAHDTICCTESIGKIRYINASFASPLLWIFDNIQNTGWNEIDPRSPSMIGNGFAWGQSSHILAWIYYVCNSINASSSLSGSNTSISTGDDDDLHKHNNNNNKKRSILRPRSVFCRMNHSLVTGADVSHSATIICEDTTTTTTTGSTSYNHNNNNHNNNNNNNDDGIGTDTILFNLSGTTLLPGNAHSNPSVPKEIRIEIYGTNGTILYNGNDQNPYSGQLVLRKGYTGETIVLDPQFYFEDLYQNGIGPRSLQTFINSCLLTQKQKQQQQQQHVQSTTSTSKTSSSITSSSSSSSSLQSLPSFQTNCPADSYVGLLTVQTIEAMYRSNKSGQIEDVLSIPTTQN